MILQGGSASLLRTCVCGRMVGGKGLQGAAEVGLHVLGQQARGGPQPVGLFPAPLPRLAQARGAAGSADCPVVHLKQHPQAQFQPLRSAFHPLLVPTPCTFGFPTPPFQHTHPFDGQRGDAQHRRSPHTQHEAGVGQHEVDGRANAIVVLLAFALPSACHLTWKCNKNRSEQENPKKPPTSVGLRVFVGSQRTRSPNPASPPALIFPLDTAQQQRFMAFSAAYDPKRNNPNLMWPLILSADLIMPSPNAFFKKATFTSALQRNPIYFVELYDHLHLFLPIGASQPNHGLFTRLFSHSLPNALTLHSNVAT